MLPAWLNLRGAYRPFRRNPGGVVVALCTLALAIGANTALFSIVNAVILKPLPFKDPERLVYVDGWSPIPETVQQWKESSGLFDDIALATQFRPKTLVSKSGGPQRIKGFHVSIDFFPVLGIKPEVGRWFLPEDHQGASEPATIISHKLWKDHFQLNDAVVGQPLSLDGTSYTVIGVLPPEFRVFRFASADILLLDPPNDTVGSVVGRLSPGVSLDLARARLETLTDGMVPVNRHQESLLRNVELPAVRVRPLLDHLVGEYVETQLWVLMGIVGCVLLIGCANVSNLLLAWAAGRRAELAIRAALGATRSHLVSQMLIESVFLFFLAGSLGVGLAFIGLGILVHMLKAMGILRLNEVGIDGTVLLFSLVITVSTGLLFGLLPALRTTRGDVKQALQGRGSGASDDRGRRRLRNALVIGEIALTLTLLVGAGLLVRTFLILRPSDPGFDSKNKLTFRLELPPSRYAEAHQEKLFVEELLERLSASPEVVAVSAINYVRLGGMVSMVKIPLIDGHPASAPESGYISFNWLTPNYLEVMGVSIVEGRTLSEGDEPGTHPVAVINQTFAQTYWADESPLGKRFTMDYYGTIRDFTVVGVTKDLRFRGTSLRSIPEVHVSLKQWDIRLYSASLIVQTRRNPMQLLPFVRESVKAQDPTLPLLSIDTMDDILAHSVERHRVQSVLLSVFAGIALVMSLAGVYGVLSFTVAERTRELGIRIALGARPSNVAGLILRQGLTVAVTGIAIGLAGAWATTRLLKYQIYSVTTMDPLTLVVAPLLILFVALLACWFPARRATRVDPMVALRYE